MRRPRQKRREIEAKALAEQRPSADIVHHLKKLKQIRSNRFAAYYRNDLVAWLAKFYEATAEPVARDVLVLIDELGIARLSDQQLAEWRQRVPTRRASAPDAKSPIAQEIASFHAAFRRRETVELLRLVAGYGLADCDRSAATRRLDALRRQRTDIAELVPQRVEAELSTMVQAGDGHDPLKHACRRVAASMQTGSSGTLEAAAKRVEKIYRAAKAGKCHWLWHPFPPGTVRSWR